MKLFLSVSFSLVAAWGLCRAEEREAESAKSPGPPRAVPGVSVTSGSGRVLLTSGRLELTVSTSPCLDACALRDRSTGSVFADSGYVWPGGGRPSLAGEPRLKREAAGRASVTFQARLGDLAIEQTFEARPESPDAILETITIRNAGSRTIENPDFRCHSIPSTREEHVAAVLDIIQDVKRRYPRLLIELHDPVTGPSSVHYTPTYFGYARKESFDCLWGHEFMWDSMGDLLSGRALSLHGYNLACSIPLYLHIGLKSDNANALAFWWYASTCRHLGVGGRHPDPAVREAHAAAMRTYLPLKRFYTQGEFYGLDETVHAHTLPELRASAMKVFNLTDEPAARTLEFRLREVGLPAGRLTAEGAEVRQDGDEVTLRVSVPAKGQALVRLKVGG
jgi:hypothetical protein